MALTVEDVAKRFPIHWMVWNNQHEELKNSLENNRFTKEEIETKDTRDRTPLLLAITLARIECVRALIEAGADVNCEKDGWTAVQEATATGNPELLSIVLTRRDYQRHVLRSEGIPDLLNRLSLAPDFYVEMKWEFTSWVPLVSRMCPFDTYKVYKRGGNVRVDTTLVGFENNRWLRGDRTYIFRGQGGTASFVELDHEAGSMWCEYLEASTSTSTNTSVPGREWPPVSRSAVSQRLAAPLAINYLDTDKISFERNKSGIWGWRQDKTEEVNGYECKVFSANNVELVSKTRTEHLPRGERRDERRGERRAPLAGLLALADAEPGTATHPQEESSSSELPSSSRSQSEENLQSVSWEEYFSKEPMEKDIGRQKEIQTKVQKFKATLWLCEDYPLELQEQIVPILDLMAAISSPHFAKLKDFIQMQLPSGFPVKIEIPLFHVVNARITFGNIFGVTCSVPHVEAVRTGVRDACLLDDACFAVGAGYRDASGQCARDEDALLHYAIRQSIIDTGTGTGTGGDDDQVDVWEALRGERPSTPRCSPQELLAHEERQLQRAIEASLAGLSLQAPVVLPLEEQHQHHHQQLQQYRQDEEEDPELVAALQLSVQEQARRDIQLEDEKRALDEALRLSLLDN